MAAAAAAPAPTPQSAPVPPVAGARAPTAGAELERLWKESRGEQASEEAVIASLDAANLPALLKQSLTADLLVGLTLASLRFCTSSGGGDAHAAAVLGALPNVPRFSMIRMFIVGKDKASLVQAFDAALSAGADVKAVRSAFGV